VTSAETKGAEPAPVALITGAVGGLGAEFVRGFDDAGYRLVLIDVATEAMNKLARRLRDAAVVTADLMDEAQAPRIVATATDRFGRLDVLINSAGLFHAKPTEEVTAKEWDDTFSVNLRAPFLLMQAASKVMKAQRSGCVINISSTAGFYPRADQAAYCASKAGLEHLTRVLALDLAPYGVRVNGIRPGVVETGMARRDYGEDGLARWAAAIPMHKLAQPRDLVEAALYIAGATHLTGQLISIDGGQTINFVKA
jgi:NAD(P)-dependent dehydrogenase (short-subunit alcohol dehydrogenase family)